MAAPIVLVVGMNRETVAFVLKGTVGHFSGNMHSLISFIVS